VVSDFDGVTFHLSTPESKTKILISINVKCFKELVQYGAQEVLEREYGPYIVSPEPGYDFSVQIDLENLPAEQEAKDELIMKLALLKRNAMAAPFERAFDEFAKLAEEASHYTSESAPQGMKEGGEVMAIHYREEEAIYIKASFDRVTVIFSTVFREETDRIFGKVFLQVRVINAIGETAYLNSVLTSRRNLSTPAAVLSPYRTRLRCCSAVIPLSSLRESLDSRKWARVR
jgi:actin related protein 2/3 complex subunit 2